MKLNEQDCQGKAGVRYSELCCCSGVDAAASCAALLPRVEADKGKGHGLALNSRHIIKPKTEVCGFICVMCMLLLHLVYRLFSTMFLRLHDALRQSNILILPCSQLPRLHGALFATHH